MSDNRIISKSKYVVNSVTRATVDNKLTRRPYTNTSDSNSKRQQSSNSFNDTLSSTSSHNSPDDESKNFSNDLDNMLRLKSEENSRLVQSRFKQNTLNNSTSRESANETELHNKLNQAMAVHVDASILSKKIELLNSLKNESNI